jgi:glutamate-1-semialdehyde 2,1-aminomutase
VRDDDVFLVPKGYHGPSVAVPGHHMYFLNVLAGPSPQRTMQFCDDPQQHWVRALVARPGDRPAVAHDVVWGPDAYENDHYPGPMTALDAWPLVTAASERLYERAMRVMPGGVQGEGRRSSPYPVYMSRGLGSRVWDADGNELLDYHAAFGAVLLGHNHPEVAEAILRSLEQYGVTFATANPLEVELAERIVELVPSAEKAVFSCTGTEVTYHAIRLARAITGKPKILKLEGHYHGWHDYAAWSVHFDPAAAGNKRTDPRPIPASDGILPDVAESVVVREYNDAAGIADAVKRFGHEIAALIMEPVFLNGGVVAPEPGFLETCRQLCSDAGILLIFDEVITGFRLAPGGAQELLGVRPDLTTMGKAVANGFPVSVLAGRSELMSNLAPQGNVLFAGTFAGHVLNLAAALKTTEVLSREGFHGRLDQLGGKLKKGIQAAIYDTGVRAQIKQLGSVWTLYCTDTPIRGYRDLASFAKDKENHLQRLYRHHMLERGIYIHPHYMLRGYITAAHTDEDIERTVSATAEFFRAHHRLLT